MSTVFYILWIRLTFVIIINKVKLHSLSHWKPVFTDGTVDDAKSQEPLGPAPGGWRPKTEQPLAIQSPPGARSPWAQLQEDGVDQSTTWGVHTQMTVSSTATGKGTEKVERRRSKQAETSQPNAMV